MKPPDTSRLYASVWRPRLPGRYVPYEFEYVLWYAIPHFPMMVRLGAYPPVPRVR